MPGLGSSPDSSRTQLLALARANHLPRAFLLVLALSAALSARAAEPAVLGIEAVGTAFRAKLSDGSVKQAAEFAGAVLVFKINDQPTRIRIVSKLRSST
jgi:ABC-type sugar transport system substrate-binding protein